MRGEDPAHNRFSGFVWHCPRIPDPEHAYRPVGRILLIETLDEKCNSFGMTSAFVGCSRVETTLPDYFNDPQSYSDTRFQGTFYPPPLPGHR